MSRSAQVACGLVFIAVVGACTTTQKGPETRAVRPDPSAPAPALAEAEGGAAAAAAADASTKPRADTAEMKAWASDWPKAWTDPRIVKALAARCDFVPVRPPREHPGMGDTPPDPFACSLGYSQSCSPDPCQAYSGHCEQECEKTCVDCGKPCVPACEACKATCHDDACREACATKCAECKQTCNRTMDRCVSGDCGKAHTACAARLKAVWKSNGCAAKCAAFSKCQEKCNRATDVSACNDKCSERVSPGYATCAEKCSAAPDSDLCHVKCYETAPCAPFICMGGQPQ